MVKVKFERKTCGRCNGSGRYSYCERYGDMCMGCSGVGIVHTRRGEAASTYFYLSVTKTVDKLEPGDVFYDPRECPSGTKKKWRTVVRIELVDYGGVVIHTPHARIHRLNFERMYIAHTEDQLAKKYDEALRYQSTLGVSGKQLKQHARKDKEDLNGGARES